MSNNQKIPEFKIKHDGFWFCPLPSGTSNWMKPNGVVLDAETPADLFEFIFERKAILGYQANVYSSHVAIPGRRPDKMNLLWTSGRFNGEVGDVYSYDFDNMPISSKGEDVGDFKNKIASYRVELDIETFEYGAALDYSKFTENIRKICEPINGVEKPLYFVFDAYGFSNNSTHTRYSTSGSVTRWPYYVVNTHCDGSQTILASGYHEFGCGNYSSEPTLLTRWCNSFYESDRKWTSSSGTINIYTDDCPDGGTSKQDVKYDAGLNAGCKVKDEVNVPDSDFIHLRTLQKHKMEEGSEVYKAPEKLLELFEEAFAIVTVTALDKGKIDSADGWDYTVNFFWEHIYVKVPAYNIKIKASGKEWLVEFDIKGTDLEGEINKVDGMASEYERVFTVHDQYEYRWSEDSGVVEWPSPTWKMEAKNKYRYISPYSSDALLVLKYKPRQFLVPPDQQ